MATAFAGANGTVLHNHNHDRNDSDHDQHAQRHDPRPQYRRATSSQTSQNSFAASLNRTISQGDGRVFSSIQEEGGFQGQSQTYANGGNRFTHKHTPSLQLNGNLGPQLSDPSWKGELAFSPPPVTPDLRSDSHTSFPGLDSTIHSHSHSHAHTHSTSREHSSSHEDENMTAQDLSHMVGNEVSQLSRAYLSKTEFFGSLLISWPFAFTALLVRRHADDAEITNPTVDTISLSAFEISTIVSITLLLVGLIGKLDQSRQAASHESSLGFFTTLFSQRRKLETLFATVFSLALPFYSISNLGSARVTAFLLSAIITRSVYVSDAFGKPKRTVFTKTLRQYKFLSAALALQVFMDFAGYTSKTSVVSLASGYLALVLSVAYFPLPFLTFKKEATNKIDARSPTAFEFSKDPRPLLSPVNANLALAGSLLTSAAAVILLSLSPSVKSRSVTQIVFRDCWTTALPLSVALSYMYPPWLISRYKVGYAIALASPVLVNYLLALSDLQATMTQFVLMSIAFIATTVDGRLVADANQFHRKRGNSILTTHQHSHSQPTAISRYLIAKTVDWPILHSILAEDDSRPVFYFMLLNLTFMGIQAFYSIVTESLGLLSDSIHMFFDCFALAVGLAAAVMSKWPPSARFPYGYGMLNVLAGFGNGVFLMLISIEIVYEAFERLVEGVEMNRLKELFVVSVLGMLVNLVGLVAMPHHHHHGHDHGHGHSHGHSHGHDHSHSHGNDHNHAHGGDCHDHDHDHGHGHENGHLHSHSSVENIRHQRLQSQASNASLASPRVPKPSPLGSVDINAPQRLAPQHAHTHSHSPSLRQQPSQSSLQHSHSPSIPHAHDHSHSHSGSHGHGHGHGHGGHSHDHMNENMMGIWLHIAADALGSLSVVISTVLIHFSGRSFWDPLASILIALLIFASAVPLVRSCATRLLLTNPAGLEFDLKNALQSVSALRGVDGVCVPKFWSVEGEGEGSTVTHGVLHVIANPRDSLEEVRERVELEFRRREMQVLVQVERESDGRCWCGGGRYKM